MGGEHFRMPLGGHGVSVLKPQIADRGWKPRDKLKLFSLKSREIASCVLAIRKLERTHRSK
ncbi:hypothetical protein H920_17019 [Fukomys damarensis]|uniref:Uncharacterized protein n=1 Tax=Fukomys damarensis TaxID=885580 RepID=A0A091CQW7_FUKDA|nr:hypothetical protein H920_17019 [Fukomys damarensis]